MKACLLLWSKKLGQPISAELDRGNRKEAKALMLETGTPMPTIGKQLVRDGRTGEFMTSRLPSAS